MDVNIVQMADWNIAGNKLDGSVTSSKGVTAIGFGVFVVGSVTKSLRDDVRSTVFFSCDRFSDS